MWSWTSSTTPVGTTGRIDSAEKTAAFPGVPYGQAPWFQDYSWAVYQEFVRRVKQLNLTVANVQMTAVALDSQGLGTLTLTFTTS